MDKNQLKQWRKRLRFIFTSEFAPEVLRNWGFFDFLKWDVGDCSNTIEVAAKLYADMVDSEGAIDHLRGIYSCVLLFLEYTAESAPDRNAEIVIARLSVGPIDRAAIYKWFEEFLG